MAKVFTGKDGRLFLGANTSTLVEQVKVTNWSLTGNLEMLETTSLGDRQRTYAPGVQDFSGSATLLYYHYHESDGTERNDAAAALKKILRVDGVSDGDTVEIRLQLAEGSINRNVRLTTYITSVSYGASVGEVTSAQINFQGTGALLAVTL